MEKPGSELGPWPAILAKNIAEFFQDEETRSKIEPMAKMAICECLRHFFPGGVLAYKLVNGLPLVGEVNKSEDVKALHARLDTLEREVREFKQLYKKKAKEMENVLKKKEKKISFWCFIILFAIPLCVFCANFIRYSN